MQWFGQAKTKVDWGYKDLSQEDKAVFEQGQKYSNDSQALTQVMRNFAAGLCAYATAKNVPLPYDTQVLSATLVKM